jgi:nucleoside-diphosphate-sugar epimerase
LAGGAVRFGASSGSRAPLKERPGTAVTRPWFIRAHLLHEAFEFAKERVVELVESPPPSISSAAKFNEFSESAFVSSTGRGYSGAMQAIGSRAIQSVEELERLLSEPTDAVVQMMRRMEGDIILLGVGGKIGPSLARMAKLASELAGTPRRVIGVSRFSNPGEAAKLERHGVETIACDLLDEDAVGRLPDAPNVIHLAGLKFGSAGRVAATWAMNTFLPSIVCRKYRHSRIVAYSTGAVYGMASVAAGGATESTPADPVGEYAMSCLGRERMFEHFSRRWSVPVALIRLFYACELRYGVLVDIARMIMKDEPIDLAMGHFNIIWQGDNNAMTLLALEHVSSPPFVLNVTGPEILSIREVGEKIGRQLGREPRFYGKELGTTCLGNAAFARKLFGEPRVPAAQLLDWVVDWVRKGGEYLGKPTHFDVRDGKY